MVVSGGKCLPFYSGTEAMLHLTPMLFSFDYDLHLTCKLREQNDNNLLSAYNGIQRPIPFVNLNKKDDIIVKVGRSAITSKDEYHTIIDAKEKGDVVMLRIERSGKQSIYAFTIR